MTIGRRSGTPRPVTVGYLAEPDGSILVAAGSPDAAWAANLLDDPRVTWTIGDRTQDGIAELLEDRDASRGRIVRELILRSGTPAEGLGSGPIFRLRPTGESAEGRRSDPADRALGTSSVAGDHGPSDDYEPGG
jgi:deazaflavin-dependent oxidoreductase (nitroreductase family)